MSLERRRREGGLVPGCGRVCGCHGHRLGKSANHSLEALELVLHPTAVFSALDENVAVCPVQVHGELWCSLTVHWHSLAHGWQTHTALCRRSEALLLGGGRPLSCSLPMWWCSHGWREGPSCSGIVAPLSRKGEIRSSSEKPCLGLFFSQSLLRSDEIWRVLM